MKNMISADIERILRKKSFWIVFILPCIMALFYALISAGERGGSFYYAVLETDHFSPIGNMMFGLSIFLGVYADEFRSKSMQAMIGRGISRTKIVLVKFIDSVLLTVLIYGIFSLLLFVMALIFHGGIGALEAKAMYLQIALFGVKALGFSTIATVFIFLTGNVPVAMIVNVLLYISGSLLKSIAAFNDELMRVHPERYLFDGIIDRIYGDLILSLSPSPLWLILAAAYICGAICLSVLIFRSKELEF